MEIRLMEIKLFIVTPLTLKIRVISLSENLLERLKPAVVIGFYLEKC
jgi:hypothetical protein